jgi:phosphatidylinositol-3-phosphatase
MLAFVASACACAAVPGGHGGGASRNGDVRVAAPGVPAFKHVWVVMLENHSIADVLNSPHARYLRRLARRYSYASRFYAVRHPSLPNYLGLVSGSTQGCATDRCVGGYEGKTIVSQLARHRLRWGAYLEGLPDAGYLGGDVGSYVRHHDPFVYFASITSSSARRRRLQPLSALRTSLRRAPAFSFVVPSNAHNMHTGTVGASDRWLRRWIPLIQESHAYRRSGVIFITFDEGRHDDTSGCCLRGVHGGRVLLLAISRRSRRGYVSQVAHPAYALLRTIEAAFRLGPLGAAARARPYTGLWR